MRSPFNRFARHEQRPQPRCSSERLLRVPLARRRALVAVARERDLTLLDDDAYGFLEADPPPNLARLAPERAFYVLSFSKPVAPGFKLSFLVTPPTLRAQTTAAIRQTASGAAPLWAELILGWLGRPQLARGNPVERGGGGAARLPA